MIDRTELKKFSWILGLFLVAYFLPVGHERFSNAILESITLLHWYAREHVILCLIPAFFIAGVISVFINQAAVIRYFGAQTRKVIS